MDVTLPKWGMTMQEGVVSKWLVAVGEQVTEGQPIAQIETDKVLAEVEAPATGTLAEIVVAEDESAEVGDVIARIDG